ncbi:uncharacterized protein LOC127866733 [Dreissena polymorpha]|uniref:uncharacterized protein LOC127866733 n=1 Tax=Dreissena polymorpha TaxID=45954 RepID=UPI002264B9E5|nr:uncharacterized protein LOC127866733 [Dreissena polymorpha]
MPPKKRKNSDVPPTITKKRAKTTASHTATTSVNTNDPAILAITENTRNRAARRPVLNTPGLSGNQSQAVNEGDSHLTSQIIGNQSQPGVDVHTQMTRQIVDNISSTLESLVERKISEILGKNMPQTSTPMTDQEQHLNDRGIQSIQHEGHWNNLPNYNIVQTEHSTFTDSTVQSVSALLQPTSYSHSSTSQARGIVQGFEHLLNASLAPSTMETYKRGWRLFHEFCQVFSISTISLPLSVTTLALFVAFLHQKPMSVKSITTYLSGISYAHKLQNVTDPTCHFLISSLIKGAQRLSPSYDLRLPITIDLLDKLIFALKHTCETHYHEKLFAAMFLFAFHAFARCSEIASCKPSTKSFILQLADIQFDSITAPSSVSVTYHRFKHNNGKPHTINFSHGHTKQSAVHALKDYISVRGQYPGPIFTLTSGLPVPRRIFDKQLSSCLRFCGLDSKRYKSHSFRIGKATDCAQRGYSDAKIRHLGRWHSNAFQKYIRITDN